MKQTVSKKTKASAWPWQLALLWLPILFVVFFATYTFANWWTAQRAPVPNVQFDWEKRIPFLAWTIIPYWSTDLLYALSLFVCRTREELWRHVRRLLLVQLVSVAGFLLVPLQCNSVRPQVSGLSGDLFGLLLGFDQPYNQAPSLHIGLTVVLWARFSQHLRGAQWLLLRGWFLLTAVSTLTTFQHHFVDLPAGFWVGLLALAAFPEVPITDFAPQHGKGRWVFAVIFAGMAAGCVALALHFGGWGLWLLWVAGAMGLVSVMYMTGKPFLLRKENGRFPWELHLLFSPYLWLARLNAWAWTGQRPMTQEIADGVWLGRAPRSVAELHSHGFRSVVDFTSEIVLPLDGQKYWAVPMLDMVPPNVRQLEAGVAAIQASAGDRPTLVCCALGYSRSASSVAAWLLQTGKAKSMVDAVAQITAKRPRVVLTRLHRAKLQEFAQKLGLS